MLGHSRQLAERVGCASGLAQEAVAAFPVGAGGRLPGRGRSASGAGW